MRFTADRKRAQPRAREISPRKRITDVAQTDVELSEISRRRFCNHLMLTSAALVIAAKDVASVTVEPHEAVRGPAMRIEGAAGLMPGSSLVFAYPTQNDPAILLRTQDGFYYAYSQRCSHLGCSVQFERDRGCLQCPCHRGTFDARSGNVLHGPPRRSLDQIFLQLRGREVWAVGRRSDNEPLIAKG